MSRLIPGYFPFGYFFNPVDYFAEYYWPLALYTFVMEAGVSTEAWAGELRIE